MDIYNKLKEFDFAALLRTQSFGDFRSLNNKHRKVVRFHPCKDIDNSVKQLSDAVR